MAQVTIQVYSAGELAILGETFAKLAKYNEEKEAAERIHFAALDADIADASAAVEEAIQTAAAEAAPPEPAPVARGRGRPRKDAQAAEAAPVEPKPAEPEPEAVTEPEAEAVTEPHLNGAGADAHTLTKDDLDGALRAYAAKHGAPKLMPFLKSLGHSTIRDIPVGKYPEVIVAAEAACL